MEKTDHANTDQKKLSEGLFFLEIQQRNTQQQANAARNTFSLEEEEETEETVHNTPRTPKRKRTEYYSSEELAKRAQGRINKLIQKHGESTFSRNHSSFETLYQEADTTKKMALFEEKKALTQYLVNRYLQDYASADPKNPSPIKRTRTDSNMNKHTRPKRKPNECATRPQVALLIEEEFQEGSHWDAIIKVLGYTIYQRDSIIAPFEEDHEGNLNLGRMIEGEAPIGPDGRSVNLHHLLREDPGPLCEITAAAHARESGPLHPVGPGISDRSHFDNFRTAYWRARAYDIIDKMDDLI